MNVNIFFEYGRLGNQIFQYAALKSMYPGYTLFLLGFSSLNNLLHEPKAIIFECNNKSGHFFKRLLRISLNIIGEMLGVITFIKESNCGDNYFLVVKKGLYKNIQYIKSGNFQSNKYLADSLLKDLKIKDSVLKLAELEFMKFHNGILGQKFFFIHIRRGDYLWRKPEESPALSPDWYLNGVNLIKEIYPEANFIVFSDDIKYAKSNFGHIDKFFFFSKNEIIDIAVMSLCDGGVLSASSYSFWAAYFSRKRSNDGIYIAPNYWMGHRNGKWDPTSEIKVDWITYV